MSSTSSSTAVESQLRSRVRTVVFTNLAGSAELKRRLGDSGAAQRILRHESLVADLVQQNGGEIVYRAGDGFLLMFRTPTEAVTFALSLQQAHAGDADLPRVRIGSHMGEITETRDSLPGGNIQIEGFAVDLASRIQALALPGQILLSYPVFENARQRLAKSEKFPRLAWRSHGRYLFKGHDRPLAVFEVGIEGQSPLVPPLDHEKARHVPESESTDAAVRWRPAAGLDMPRRPNWNLVKKLGDGGGGEVWLASQRGTGERRVFKFCFDHQQLKWLQREVTVFRLLKETLGDRTDIAKILDWQFDDPPFYLEFEYVGGASLPAWAQERGGLKTIPLSTRLELVAQVAEAIAAAHSVGILHKDIKPSNILIVEGPEETRPRVTMIDFGIGIVTDQALLAAKGITALGITQGETPDSYSSKSGTRLYMAPELLEGQPITTSADIYSLGIVLYQMITANLQHALATGWQREVDDELLRHDIAACVDGEPERRLSSAAELARRLRTLDERRQQLNEEHAREAAAAQLRVVAQRARQRNYWLAAGMLGLLLLLGFSIALALQQRHRARLEQLLKEGETTAKTEAVRLKILAEDAQREAVSQRESAERMRGTAEEEQYFANIGFADANLRQGRVTKARELLFEKTPAASRNWEWGYLLKQSSPDLMTLAKYETPGGALHAEFNPSGDRIATGDRDGQVSIYDAQSGRRLQRAKPHKRSAWRVAWRRDGRLLAVASLDFTGSVLDASNLQVVSTLRGSTDVIRGIDFSPDGRRIATCGADRAIRLWDTHTGTLLRTGRHPNGVLYDLHYSPDGARIISGSLDSTLDLWDANTLIQQRTIFDHTKAVHSATFSTDGSRILSSGSDKTARIFDAQTAQQLRVFEDTIDWIHCASFSPDGSRIATSDNSGICRVWDIETSRQLASVQDGTQMYKVFFSPDGKRLVTSNWDTFKVWDVAGLMSPAVQADEPQQQDAAAIFAQPHESARIICYPVERGRDWHNNDAPYNVPAGFTSFHDKSRTFIACSFFSAFSRDGAHRIVIDEATMKATGTHAGSDTSRVPLGSSTVYSSVFSPDGKLAATGGYQNVVTIYDPRKWTTVRTIRNVGAQTSPISCVRFSPDSKRIFAGGFDGYAAIYEVANGTTVSAMHAHVRPVITAQFTPDGTRIATGSTDKMAKLFAVQNGEQLTTMTGHTSYVHDIAFSPDGTRVLTCSEDDTAKLWETVSGREVLPVFDVRSQDMKLLAAGFTSDGKSAYAVTSSRTLLVADTYPWHEADYPAPSSSMPKRVELWKRTQFNKAATLEDIDW